MCTRMLPTAKFPLDAIWSFGVRRCCFGKLTNNPFKLHLLQNLNLWRWQRDHGHVFGKFGNSRRGRTDWNSIWADTRSAWKSFENHHFHDQIGARRGVHGVRKRAYHSVDHSRSQYSFAEAEWQSVFFHPVYGCDPFCRYPHWSMRHGKFHVA